MSPSIAHALFGGTFAFIFYILSRSLDLEKKFNERMLYLSIFNSFIGPDLFKVFFSFNLDFLVLGNPLTYFVHSLIGWPVWCLGLMWIWYFILNIGSTEENKITKGTTLLLLIAVGEMHFFLDAIDTGVHLIAFGEFQIYIPRDAFFFAKDFYTYGPLHDVFPWFSMFEMFLIGLFFLIMFTYVLFKKELKHVYIVIGIGVVVILSCFILFGSIVFGMENDIGVAMLFLSLIFLPILMIIYAVQIN